MSLVVLLSAFLLLSSTSARGDRTTECRELGSVASPPPSPWPPHANPATIRTPLPYASRVPCSHVTCAVPRRFTGLQLCSDCDALATYVSDAGLAIHTSSNMAICRFALAFGMQDCAAMLLERRAHPSCADSAQ